MKIYLASRSERRQQLLQQIHIDFELIDIDIDETYHSDESPENYVLRMAKEKAEAGKSNVDEDDIIIAADTSVILDNHVLGKAESNQQATLMLEQLSGRKHEVLTSVCVFKLSPTTTTSRSKVLFKTLSQSEINDYVASNEPIGKAGGYAIQGLAAKFIHSIEGSYSGIMGLPLFETAKLLNELN